jgi:DNA-binding IclR family transcriptional regulator
MAKLHSVPRPASAEAPRPARARSERAWGVAISRAFEVLTCFTPQQPDLGNGEIVRATGLPKATVSRLTCILVELGYLRRTSTGKYRLAWGVVSLGYPLLTSMGLRQVARPAMHELALEHRINVNLGALHRVGVVFVESVRHDESSATRPDIGAPRSLLRSAMGRALLLALDDTRRTALLNQAALADPAGFQGFPQRLEAARRSVLERGFCVSDGEHRAGYLALAVPMRTTELDEPLAFNCAVPAYQMPLQRFEDVVGPQLTAMVRRLENQLGID